MAGPFANTKDILGSWACFGRADEALSIKEGIENLINRKIMALSGCSAELLETDNSKIIDAVNMAKTSDTIIACVGEISKDSGEGASRADLNLPKVQIELVK